MKSPRHWRIRLIDAIVLAWVALWILAPRAHAQPIRFDQTSTTTSASCASGRQCTVLSLPGTIVNFCTTAGFSTLTACLANPLTTYTNVGGGTPCPPTAQLTPATGGACLSTADAQGAFGIWFQPQTAYYYLRVPATAGGGTYGPYPFSFGVNGQSSSVTYDLGTPNALSTTVANKLNAVYDAVADFGWSGNGVTVNSAVITKALADTQLVNGKLTVPCGNYLFSVEMTITKRITMEGGGPGDSVNGAPCVTLTKTADVIGIHIKSGADYTVLDGFSLTSTAGSGTSDNIVIGDVDATNGAGNVILQNLTVSSAKGSCINVRNGNTGTIYNATVSGCGAHGLVISSQQTSVDNTNAWNIYGLTALGNTLDGMRLDDADSTAAFGFVSEGNGRYGVYCGRPHMKLFGYSESNTTDEVFLDSGCFQGVGAIHTVNNTWAGSGINANAILNQSGGIELPSVNPLTMRQIPPTSQGRVVTAPTYGASITINNDLGDDFYITATNGTAFTVMAPSNVVFSQRITITIFNNTAATLGTVTWSAYALNSRWLNPLPGCSRSIDFQLNSATSTWTEIGGTPSDVCSGSNHADYVFSSTAPVVIPTLSSTSASTAFSYPNIAIAATWRTTCNALTTTVGTGSGTVVLTLLYNGAAYGENSPLTLDLTSASIKKISVSDWETIPASTAAATVGIRWTVGGVNTGGVFTVSCVSERVQ